MKNNTADNPHAHVTNDAIRELQRQRDAHRGKARKLGDDLKQLDREHRAARERLEKEYEGKRADLYQKRHEEDRAAAKLDRAIANEQSAEVHRKRDEAEFAAHVERLRPALARLGVLARSGGYGSRVWGWVP